MRLLKLILRLLLVVLALLVIMTIFTRTHAHVPLPPSFILLPGA